jgi:NAD(P)H dehydrogenase (quinone)
MNVLWVFAHPEPGSLGGALRDVGIAAARDAGHDVVGSDLYAMGWKAALDRTDVGVPPGDDTIGIAPESARALAEGRLAPDIVAEHAKLDAADAVVFQFPLWWYGPPAILKGWFDRVLVKGYGYGVHRPDGRTQRYGEGKLAGKRALVIVSSGSPAPALGPRGINGQLDQVLFPLLHGTLFYIGMDVLPPLGVFGAMRVSDTQFAAEADRVRAAVGGLADAAPIPYRAQNGGDYDRDLVLCPEIAPGEAGLGVHLKP